MIYVIVARTTLDARVWASQRSLRPTSVIPLIRGEDTRRTHGLAGAEVTVVRLSSIADEEVDRTVMRLTAGGAAVRGPSWWPGGGALPEPQGADLRGTSSPG